MRDLKVRPRAERRKGLLREPPLPQLPGRELLSEVRSGLQAEPWQVHLDEALPRERK